MALLRAIGLFFALNSGIGFGQMDVYIPNIFTPDGDGVNDIFKIQSVGYDEITCTIYNRHGEPVYRFYGLNGTWDGYTHAGVKVTPGVYFVFLEISSDGNRETLQGALQVHY